MGEFSDTLKSLADSAGFPLDQDTLSKMEAFYGLLEEANHSFNLTSVAGPADSALRHFFDSLALPAINRMYPGESVIDVGTGAGFPGMPAAILRSNLRFTLLDSTKKRTDFLLRSVQTLGLDNVTVINARAEEYARSLGREQFDVALSRAVAPLNTLVEYMLPFLRPGGRALAWKGPSATAEAEAAGNACRKLGGGSPLLHPYSLPGKSDFYIVEIEKISHTPPSFPRKTGKASSNPIF